LRTEDFDYELPEALIALRPMEPREAARLLCVSASGAFSDGHVGDLPDLLQPGDLLVFNDTRVIPASLKAMRPARDANGRDVSVKVLLHQEVAREAESVIWSCLLKPAKRLREGDELVFSDRLRATIRKRTEEGGAQLDFPLPAEQVMAIIADIGAPPLPPYIARRRQTDAKDKSDYQTVFAEKDGSVAAPTAGLHFTKELIDTLDTKGIERAHVTLHVGLGTFLPVKVDNIEDHKMHSERYEVTQAAADQINRAKAEGRSVIAVGTTAMRTMEAVGRQGSVMAGIGETDIFIAPGFDFQICDGLWTNFHLPQSTLLMLVSAFCGLERMRDAYAHAIAQGYRFFSYGDASLLWKAR
jgi:S-adenosylmethionine:tRNA ribosyltransferase-isomerase